MQIDPWLAERLACPWDRRPLHPEGDALRCDCGRRFPVVRGIPVLLRDDVSQTHGVAYDSLAMARHPERLPTDPRPVNGIDPYVQEAISATNGIMYAPLIGKLRDYPIPVLRLPPGEGRALLDIGCNWGRWCVAAARLGYQPVGVDPSLGALLGAARVARQLGVSARFVCADGRFLPFRDDSFDVVFSYSVLQHLAKAHVAQVLDDVRRVLRPRGTTLVQMPNAFGLRCLYHQASRGFREARDFEVRYWTPRELARSFHDHVGPAELSVDGYFSLNPQAAEAHLLPRRFRMVVRASDALRAASRRVPPLLHAADSLYVKATKPAGTVASQ